MKPINVDYPGLSINFKDANHHDADILWEPTGDVEIDGKQYKAGDQVHIMSVEYDVEDNNYSLLNKFFSAHTLEMSTADFEALKQAILSHKNDSTKLYFNDRLIVAK
ncbi:hypothetical protein [Formosa haliotis]|uniref:hypothetical protein n=1 Tax=Formosa haliotis TaxID=1555194 RepID=UPI000824E9AB|nr:hypothetical protein [Formosa haliotis]